MKTDSINKSILAIALPAIVASITTPLLSLADLAIVGHLGSADYIAAIAVGGTIFNMIYWLFGFLRFGTSGLTAQAVGAGNEAESRIIALRSVTVALACGLLLIIASPLLQRLSFAILNPDAATSNLAATYFSILIFGAPATFVQYSLTGWFVGNQDTVRPMIISLVINITNIAASLLLVFQFRLGIRGVAFGTLLAQYVGCALSIVLARPRPAPWRKVLNIDALKRFFTINLQIFLRTLCLIFVTVWFTRVGAMQGSEMLAVNTLLLQLFTFFSYFTDGFAYAAEALCGKFFGAGNLAALRRCIRLLIWWSASTALVFTVIYAVGSHGILSLLTNDASIPAAARPYIPWAVAVPLAGFMAFTADGIMIGLTRTALMLKAMLIATLAFFAIWFVASPLMANHALWLAFITYLLLRGIIMIRSVP